jgi:hypothetical protein
MTEIIGESLRAGIYTFCTEVILVEAPLDAALVIKDQKSYVEEEAVVSQPPISIDYTAVLLC